MKFGEGGFCRYGKTWPSEISGTEDAVVVKLGELKRGVGLFTCRSYLCTCCTYLLSLYSFHLCCMNGGDGQKPAPQEFHTITSKSSLPYGQQVEEH
jgi:hypothetical protein